MRGRAKFGKITLSYSWKQYPPWVISILFILRISHDSVPFRVPVYLCMVSKWLKRALGLKNAKIHDSMPGGHGNLCFYFRNVGKQLLRVKSFCSTLFFLRIHARYCTSLLSYFLCQIYTSFIANWCILETECQFNIHILPNWSSPVIFVEYGSF